MLTYCVANSSVRLIERVIAMHPLRFRYRTLELDGGDIHLCTLRDNQQFSEDAAATAEQAGVSPSSWALFGLLWPSAEVLANFLSDFDIKGKRILEVGCGIGLASLMLNQRHADITSTDYNPSAGEFLAKNVLLNEGKEIPFTCTGWGDELTKLGKFDLIIGSDILYEPDHITLLSNFIRQHSHTHCEVIVVDPGRGNHAKFSKRMITLGYTHSQSKPLNSDYLEKPFKGQILRYTR